MTCILAVVYVCFPACNLPFCPGLHPWRSSEPGGVGRLRGDAHLGAAGALAHGGAFGVAVFAHRRGPAPWPVILFGLALTIRGNRRNTPSKMQLLRVRSSGLLRKGQRRTTHFEGGLRTSSITGGVVSGCFWSIHEST